MGCDGSFALISRLRAAASPEGEAKKVETLCPFLSYNLYERGATPMTEHELDILLRDYGGAVRSVCRAILPGHPQDAEEAEADTFYKLWRGAHLPADETHRRRLVVQAARQCAIDRYRALLRRGETLPLDERDDAELAVALESELETRELMAQVMALPPPDGELFLRRYVYGETAAQLGVHFNMPAATVRTRLHRARLALQKLLKEG